MLDTNHEDFVPDAVTLDGTEILSDNVKSLVALEKDVVALGTTAKNILIFDIALRRTILTIPTTYRHIGILNKLGRDYLAASHNFANDLHVYNWRTGESVGKIENVQPCWGRDNPVLHEQVIITGQRNPTLLISRFPTGELVNKITTTYACIYCILPMTQDTFAIAGASSQNEVQFIDVDGDTKSKELVGHTGAVFSMCRVYYHVIVTGSFDNTIRVWNWQTTECLHTLVGQSIVRQVAPLFGRYFVSGGDDSSIKIWDLKNGSIERTMYGHNGSILNIGDLKDGRLVSVSEEKALRIWRWKKPKDTSIVENLSRICMTTSLSDILLK